MSGGDRKASRKAEEIKRDAKGAMAPSKGDASNDGAHSADPTGDATQPTHDHSSPRTPETDRETAGEE